MIITVLFYTFVAFTGVQLIYYVLFSSVLWKQKKANNSSTLPISVIIFAKNCASYLEKNITSFLNQKYPNFEILLVNNASFDETDDVIEQLKEKHPQLKIVDVENNEAFWGNKKYATTLAIKAAKYEHLLFTEANCVPKSEFWIAEMSKLFSEEKTIVLGYKKLILGNNFTSYLIRFQHVLFTFQGFFAAKSLNPFMAFGENYGFTKTDFFRVKGFVNHIKIRDGKDDLFVRDAAQKNNASYQLSSESFIQCETNYTFKNWFLEQRKKNVLKKQYKLKHRFFLNFFLFTKIGFYALATYLFFVYSYQILLPIVLFYLLFKAIVMGLATKKLGEISVFFLSPVLDILLIFIQISIFIANLISKPNH